MVQYECEKCFHTFTRKSDYTRHMQRKTPCSYQEDIDNPMSYECKCGKSFDRKDNFKRHLLTCKKQNIKMSNNINKIKGNQNKIINNYGDVNNNNIIIKNYNLYPFGKDGIDCLTLSDKISIFDSGESPMEMIVIKVNLDPIKLDHHNVGIPDLHSGYGIVYDGQKWRSERISLIMKTLLETKQDDLIKIYEQIKNFFSEDKHNEFKNKIEKLGNIRYVDTQSMKLLINHLKKNLFNNRNLALEAKRHTDYANKLDDIEIDYSTYLKPGYTLESVENEIRKAENIKCMCKEFLKKFFGNENIAKHEYTLIIKRIDLVMDINELNKIMNSLIKSFFSKIELTDKFINDYINKYDQGIKLIL